MKASDDEIVAALTANKGVRSAAAKALGFSSLRAFSTRVAKLRKKGIDVPRSEYDYTAPVLGTSTMYGPKGEIKLQWVKAGTGLSPEKIAEAVKDAFTDIPKAKVIPAPKVTRKDLLVAYPIGDHHVGMYSWEEETGNDYDLKIAEALLTSAIKHLIQQAPAANEAVIVDVGDFTHYDTIKAETVRSHNTLDADSRYHAMIRVCLRLLIACVDEALTKHRKVTLICAPGNHNDMGAAWMVESLALYYARNPRVVVQNKAGKFFFYEFGKVLLGITHGDTGKPEKLSGVMAVDQPEAWGRTRFRHWLTGHVHNKSQVELSGCLWETFRTLAPGDAWSSAAGYRAGREMQSICYHRDYGEVGRNTFKPAMLI